MSAASSPVTLSTRPVPVVGQPGSLAPHVRRRRAAFPVALVSMPFALPTRPSAQLGLLSSIAASHGFPVTQCSAFVDFAALVGTESYVQLAGTMRPQIGDWLFGREAFDEDPDPDLSLVAEVGTDALVGAAGRDLAWLLDIRSRHVGDYLDALLAERDWSAFGVVGFTSTFQQNVASFALARRIKQQWPHVQIVFGGANFDGAMGPEWMRTMPFIDHAVTGEGDQPFPALLGALADGRRPTGIPGVLSRDGDEVMAGPAPVPLEALDDLPVPDYAEYFERAQSVGLLGPGDEARVEVPYESSRGCWWGEKATCTFCGLNGSTMRYRSKSPQRVQDELAALAQRHGSFMFFATDNILDLDYLDSVLAPLAAAQVGYWLFYEVKATLARPEMQRLYDAGVRALQPGIDSLSSHVLRLMRKGTRVTDNVNLLRWARYFGIDLYWNLLWGFPGETVDDYDDQAALIRRIPHLQPAGGRTRIDLDRFSPYFEAPEDHPVRGRRRPHVGYRYSYPDHVDLDAAAYHFEGELVGSLTDDEVSSMGRAHDDWLARWTADVAPSLTYQWAPGVLRVEDRRSALSAAVHTFGDPCAAVFHQVSGHAATAKTIAETLGLALPSVVEALDELERRALVLRDGNLHLALATPAVGARDGR